MTPQTVVGGNMPLSPGGRALENYYRAVFVGGSRTSREPVGHMLTNSFHLRDRHRGGQNLHFDPVRLCRGVFPFPVPQRRRSGSSLSR